MSKKRKLTPWYPASVKPARKGVYERAYHALCDEYSYWNGRMWLISDETPRLAMEHNGYPSYVQDLAWRGLAEKPQ